MAALIIGVGNSAVTIGLWPVHAFWTYYSLARTKKIGPILKAVMLVTLVVPIILVPVTVVLGSILVGLAYGLVAPLMATFEAVGEGHENKFIHCIVDGTLTTVKGSCTVVRDFTDVCFHSYFSLMDELHDQPPKDGKALDIDLLQLPGCVLAGLLGILLDVPIITLIAIWKAPYMLLKGWFRLVQDFIGREGLFFDVACLPFASLAILLWPLAVVGTVLAAFFSSFCIGLYGAVVVYQEGSIQLGSKYIVSAIALFDEYSNDLLHMREGSCFPRPEYRRKKKSSSGPAQTSCLPDKQRTDSAHREGNSIPHKCIPERTKSLKKTFQRLNSVQIWDRLFHSCEFYGRALVQDGVIRFSDIEEWISTGKSRILSVGLLAYSILQTLLHPVNFDSLNFLVSDGAELTKSDRADDRVAEWFFHPLMIMKEQIQSYKLEDREALYLSKLALLSNSPERMETWKNGGIPPSDGVKKAELEGLSRRLQGIATSVSRMPTFRRRFQNVVKVLYQAAVETKSVNLNTVRSLPILKSKNKLGRQYDSVNKKQAANQYDENNV
ncbi:uncharacterized membrane protein At3g27390 isoform X2 [Cryptomeria japonica]|nr:uncharacterized membrane protein At3g27390 isoform X2 [Cryptomeria japonica]